MNIFQFIKSLFEKVEVPSFLERRPFGEDPINRPRGHSNPRFTKKVRADSRVKSRKCRLSPKQRQSAIVRSRRRR